MIVKLKTLQVQFAHLSERINTAGLLLGVGQATERSFGKMELSEFELEEKNDAPIDIDDDDKYDDTDLFNEEDNEEDYDLCPGSDENTFVHLVQTCGHVNCTNCLKRNNFHLCGCRISNNIMSR